jgi:DNA-binding NarL/FixJ family response regulator
MIQTILADDHEVFRQGLAALLTAHGIEVVGMTGDRDRLLELILQERPDVAVIDISMPGISIPELLSVISQRQIPTHVLVLTSDHQPEMAEEMIRAGARGYLVKENAFDEILLAIQSVAAGRTYVSSHLAGPLLRREKAPSDDLPWTARQLAILRMVAAGDTTLQIAAKLGIHIKTVDSHRHRIREKLGTKSAAEMISVAKDRGLI